MDRPSNVCPDMDMDMVEATWGLYMKGQYTTEARRDTWGGQVGYSVWWMSIRYIHGGRRYIKGGMRYI